MPTRRHLLRAAAVLPTAALFGHPARAADETIRIGIIGQFSGPFAQAGVQFRQGVETYVAMNGASAGGRTIELLYRDVGGANPGAAKRLAEDLVVRDKVSLLGGFYLSPEASAVAPVISETRTPAVIFNAASSPIVTQSDYFVRTGQSLWQAATTPGIWAARKGFKRAYIAVSDYAPGYDVQAGFKRTFTAGGGLIVGEDRIPLNTVDYAVYAQRIAAAKPDVVQIFIPTGAPSVVFIKALAAQGVMAAGTAIIGSAEVDDTELAQFDDSVAGVYSCIFYLPGLTNPENLAFRKALSEKFGAQVIPNFAMVGAFDGTHVLYQMVASQAGKPFDGGAAIEAVKGFEWRSPRGPAKIDPLTRDIIQNEYIRRVDRVDGTLRNVVVDTAAMIRDPHEG